MKKNSYKEEVWPVIIIGAGLGGSASVAFLAQAGIPSLLVERHESPNYRPRAWIVSARTVEHFRELGLDKELVRCGTAGGWDLKKVETLQDAPYHDNTEDATAEVSIAGSAVCDQDIQERLLQEHAVQHGATFMRGANVVDISPLRNDMHEIRLESGAVLRARFVIAACAGNTSMLERLGVSYQTTQLENAGFDQILFRSAELDEVMHNRPGKMFVTKKSGAIVFRRDLSRWQVQVLGREITDIGKTVSDTVGRHVDIDLIDHSAWTPSSRLAGCFRIGNVFLSGDVAHGMPPSLGMAGNLAIGDAHNLAWKLNWVLTGRANETLLESYNAERRPVGSFLLDQSLLAMRQQQRPVSSVTIQLGLGYPPALSNALLGEGREVSVSQPCKAVPKVGARLPHHWLPDGRSTLDLVSATGYVVMSASELVVSSLPCRTVPAGILPSHRAWIVRPDGHIAAETDAESLETCIRELRAPIIDGLSSR